jgi:hypothetical protein
MTDPVAPKLTVGLEMAIGFLVTAVALAAMVLSHFSGAAPAIAVVIIVGLLPVGVLAPCRWRSLISEQRYMREVSWLIPGVGLYALVAPIHPNGGADFPRTAVIFGAASVYLVAAGRAPWRRVQIQDRWLLVTIGACAIAGVLADLPTPLGWHTLAYSCFGASAFMTLLAAASPETPKR